MNRKLTISQNRNARAYIQCSTDTDETIRFAVEELHRFLPLLGAEIVCDREQAEWVFKLSIDPSQDEKTYSINCTGSSHDRSIIVQLIGPSATEVLHSVYEMLEETGIHFDISGHILAEEAGLHKLYGFSKKVVPVVRLRGIRQYLNFPMDISSYPLSEAKDYIRSLARLRMNHIAFHSYPEQWYAYRLDNEEKLAGAFFYGQRHDIPEHPVIRKSIRNQTVFCIPEIEDVFDDKEERSRRTMQWLNELMREAKRAGFQITFSIELRNHSLEDSLSICQTVLQTYRLIDHLELFTQECGTGGWMSPNLEDFKSLIQELFDLSEETKAEIYARFDDQAKQPNGLAGLRQMPVTLKELANQMNVVHSMLLNPPLLQSVRLSLGIYATDHLTLNVAKLIMKELAPASAGLAFLTAHGSREVTDSIKAMHFSKHDVSRTTFYSWLEFDGSMYILQNSIRGIRTLLEHLTDNFVDSEKSVGFNHWRIRENAAVSRYAALACLYGPISEEAFYRQMSSQMGIRDSDRFSAAMKRLDDATNEVRDHLGNIGFCFLDCWWKKELGYFGNFRPNNIQRIQGLYESVRSDLATCLQSVQNDSGRDYLTFQLNRLACSIVHFKLVKKMTELQPLCLGKSPDDIQEHQQIDDICREAAQLAEQYLKLHSEKIHDRGCEGTLISYYHTLPAVIERVRGYYIHDRSGRLDSYSDAPPPPAI